MLIRQGASWRAQLGLRLSQSAGDPCSDLAVALAACREMSSRQVLPYFLRMHIGQQRHGLLGLAFFFFKHLSPRVGVMGVVEVTAEHAEGQEEAGMMWKAAVMDCSIWTFHIGIGKAGTAPAFIRLFSTCRSQPSTGEMLSFFFNFNF